MSEITRYDVDGRERELLEVGDGDYVRHADHLIYLREMRMDRDVERLRADTAEAEVSRLRETATLAAKVGAPNFHSMKRELAAAEQRIAELEGVLRLIPRRSTPYDANIDAALNQKSDGESQ